MDQIGLGQGAHGREAASPRELAEIEAERAQVRAGSPVGGKYDTRVDRESAAEMLAKKVEAAPGQAKAPPARKAAPASKTPARPAS